MTRVARLAAALALASVAFSAHAIGATIKREVPLLFPGVYQKNTPIQVVPGWGSLDSVAFDGLQVWVVDGNSGLVKRYDAVSNLLKGSATVPGARKLVFDGTYMWVIAMDGKVYKYDTSSRLQTGFPITLTGGFDSNGAAFDGDYLWVVTNDQKLARINVSSRSVTYFAVGYNGGLAFDGKNLWMTSPGGGTAKVDLSTMAVQIFTDFGGGMGTNPIAFDGQYVWVLSFGGYEVFKVDPTTNQVVATITGNPGVHALAFDGTLMWVTCKRTDTTPDLIQKIDVRTNQIVGTIELPAGSEIYDIAFDGTHMWVTANGTGKLHKFLAHY